MSASDFMQPELATLLHEPPEGDGWLYEVKYDGYRMLARIRRNRARLLSRTGQDWTAKLAPVRQALEALKLGDAWLDGEIVVLTAAGDSSFQALQNAMTGGRGVVYFVFDILEWRGKDLRNLPLRERKRVLERVVPDLPDGTIRRSRHLQGNGREAYATACRLGMEGLIGKRLDAPYRPGRTLDWIKLKCRSRQEFVIGGYTEGKREGFGALLVGVYDDAGRLRYAGRVGTGFNAALLRDLLPRLRRLETRAPPFHDPPRPRGVVHWVKPQLVAEVTFTGWTRDGLVRQASFEGLRLDKKPRAVHHEHAIDLPGARGAIRKPLAADG
jgi:bifunctional non-homologous end joining protein LigD